MTFFVERFIYAIIGADGAAGIVAVALYFWADEMPILIVGTAAGLGAVAGLVMGEKIWELLRGLWDFS